MNTRTVLIAVGGPAVAGVCLGLRASDPTPAFTLPLVLLGVTAMMVPALYISSALVGVAPPIRRVGGAVVESLESTGIAFFGLAPALLFLCATASEVATAAWLGRATIAIASIIGLRRLFDTTFAGGEALGRAALTFTLWSLIAVGVGAHMVGRTL